MDAVIPRLIRIGSDFMALARVLPIANSAFVVQGGDFETARKNLRFLRNLYGLNLDIEGWVNLDGIDEQSAKITVLADLVNFYASQVKNASFDNPERLTHYTVEMANLAVGGFAYGVALHIFEILPDEHSELEKLEAEFDNIPEEWETRQMQSVERLLDDLESGITYLLNQPIGDRSPIDELLEISEKIQQTAKQLYSVDTLEEPAREESIELAREILRRLKNMMFSDRPIEDAVDTGLPTEKLAFARKVAEMVDMYKNLLGEALLLDPSIINDPRVKKASGAVDSCAEGIKILALKEISNNSNIQSKKHSKEEQEKDDKTTKKIMQNMEGGLEVAAAEIEANNKDKNAKAQADQRKARAEQERLERSRRRRARRNNLIQNNVPNNLPPRDGENVGRRNVPPPPPAPPRRQQSGVAPVSTSKPENTTKNLAPAGGINLNKDALEAVRQAGNALRNSNRQAVDLSQGAGSVSAGNTITKPAASNATTISETDKLVPDDKGFAAREKDKNNQLNPRNKPTNLNM